MKLRECCLFVGILLFCLVIARGSPNSVLDHVITGVLLLMCIICLDIYWHQPANSHSLKSLLMYYILCWMTRVFGRIMMYSFKVASQKSSSQEQRLMEILKDNSQTSYAKDHDLSGVHNAEEFVSNCLLTTYSDYKSYIDDIVDYGTCDVLFPGKTDFFAMTTGTTSGKSKPFPKNLKMVRKMQASPMLLFQNIYQQIPGASKLLKMHMIIVGSHQNQTSLNVPKGAMSVVLSGPSLPFFCSPSEVFKITSERDCLYLHAIFGVRDPYIGLVSGIFSTVVLALFKLLEEEWKTICDNIESGTLPTNLKISNDMRKTLEKLLGKDGSRAKQLRSQFNQGFEKIIPRIWPECVAMTAIDTGHFKFAADTLRRKYLGNIPLMSIFHSGTEGFYGVNMDTSSIEKPTEYTILGTSNFFEFVPLSNVDEDQPKTVFADQVKVDSDYEIVITTQDGLYRYRTEDIVRITGFYNNYPKYQFLHRSGDILNLQTERLPEILISQAIQEVSQDWHSLNLVEFVSVENFHVEKIIGEESGKLFYIIFIEVSGYGFDASLQSMEIDSKLCDLVEYYSVFRKKGTIQCLQLVQVLPGTFAMMKEDILSANPDSYTGQFKMPRIIRKEKLLKFLVAQKMMQ